MTDTKQGGLGQYPETLYDAYRQSFDVDEVYFEYKTEHQHLVVFHNPKFGRVMALDGVIQTTEKDEFIYHEMLTHVPILAHGRVQRVLIVGGGDGGILREVARHAAIERIVMVEIDGEVVETCKKVLPNHSAGAFDDPRLHLVIDDGARFVQNCTEQFDVIIVDSTDPIGPGEVLFEQDFYRHCHRHLTPGGVLVTQNGVAFMQLDEARNTSARYAMVFKDHHFYASAVPTYIGGVMLMSWGTDDAALRRQPVAVIAERFRAAKLDTRYYTPDIHVGAFALPRYVLQAIGKDVV